MPIRTGIDGGGSGGVGSGITTVGDVTSGSVAFDGTAGTMLQGLDASGTDAASVPFILAAGKSTGIGNPGDIKLQRSSRSAMSGSTPNALYTALQIGDTSMFFTDQLNNVLIYFDNGFFEISDNTGAVFFGAFQSGIQIYGPSKNLGFRVNGSALVNTDYYFPPDYGENHAKLENDGSGNLSWSANGSIVSSGDSTGNNATVSSVTTVTSPNDGSSHTYLIGGYITVTAISAGTVTLTCTYTDETSASRTATFFGEGLTTAAISGTGQTGFPPVTIRVKDNTAVTLVATFAGVSVTYDVGGFIQQIN